MNMSIENKIRGSVMCNVTNCTLNRSPMNATSTCKLWGFESLTDRDPYDQVIEHMEAGIYINVSRIECGVGPKGSSNRCLNDPYLRMRNFQCLGYLIAQHKGCLCRCPDC